MKPHFPLILAGLSLSPVWSPLDAADDAEAKAVAFVVKLGGWEAVVFSVIVAGHHALQPKKHTSLEPKP